MKARLVIAVLVVVPCALAVPSSAQAPEGGYDHDALEARKPAELATPPEDGETFFEEGRALYMLHCAPCHGETGAADTPAAGVMRPPPRDFTAANFAFRTTRSGELSTDADLFRVVSRGVPGTAMPAWGEGIFTLTERERWQVVYYVKFLAELFWDEYSNPYREVQEDEPEPILEIGDPPPVTDELLARGRELYLDQESGGCARCHGEHGRGDGDAADEMYDEMGHPARPYDLTNPWRNKNGMEVEDLYRTLSSGISGTPMADFMDGIPEDEDRWALAYYAQSLLEERSVSEGAVRARRVEGALPDDPDDGAWDACEPYGVALMGQYAAAPRWQAPAVDYVRVCALHDEREVAIRVEWHDPFEDTGAEADEPAPEEDPEGAPLDEPAVEEPLDEPVDEAAVEDEPLEPVDEAAVEDEPLEPVDEAPIEDEPPDDPAEVGDDEEMLDEAGSGDDEEMVDEAVEDSERVPTYISIAEMNARAEAGPIPDRLALHMPAGARDPEDAERPHMFMGDAEHPVHAWLWSADSGGTFTEGRAIGPSEDYDTEGSVQLSGQSRWEAGRWRVVFRRAMTTPDAEDAQLGSGVLMPFTIRIWDGSAGERGLQSATSSWQYVYVEAPIPARAYVRGAVGLGLGYLFVGLGWFGLRRRGRGAG